MMESGNIGELADPTMEGAYDEEQLHRVVLTASYCVRQSPVCRPPISEVSKSITSFLNFLSLDLECFKINMLLSN